MRTFDKACLQPELSGAAPNRIHDTTMRLLVVMTHYPFPPLAGSAVVAYNSIKILSKHHTIDFICLKPDTLIQPSEFVKQLTLVPQGNVSSVARRLRDLSYLLSGILRVASRFTFKAMKKTVKEAIRRGNYDAILLFDMNAIPYCPSSCYGRLIVNIEDPQSIKLRRMAKLPIWSFWWKARLSVLAWLAASYEKNILPKLARVLLLSKADIEDFREQINCDNLAHVPYGVKQRDAGEIIFYENRERAIIYSGSMYHPPNVDGALFFLKEIFPLVLQQCPTAILWIVGADPDRRIHEAAASFEKQVLIMGNVSNIGDHIKRATVSVCPVRLRIGVQTKILEALSWGTPVVTTSAGNSGVAGASGTHLWIEDEPQLFAKRVVALLQGQDWSKLSEEGRHLIAERFSWEGSVAQLEQYLGSWATN